MWKHINSHKLHKIYLKYIIKKNYEKLPKFCVVFWEEKNASRKISETACREKYQLCLNTFQALWPICCSPLVLMVAGIFWSRVGNIKACIDKGLTRKQINFKIVHYILKRLIVMLMMWKMPKWFLGAGVSGGGTNKRNVTVFSCAQTSPVQSTHHVLNVEFNVQWKGA